MDKKKGIEKPFIHHKKKGIEKPSSFKSIETNCENYVIKGLFFYVKHSFFTLLLFTPQPPTGVLLYH